jgi:hypothetical protein
MLSTSSRRSFRPFVCASNAFIVLASCFSDWVATADLVVFCLVASSGLAFSSILSSNAAILPTKSSITSLR